MHTYLIEMLECPASHAELVWGITEQNENRIEMAADTHLEMEFSSADWEDCRQRDVEEYWAGVWDTEFLVYCHTLKSRCKLGIVSDAESNAREKVKTWVNESLFDVIVFSSEVGVCKSDPKMFQRALEQLGVAACETVFIDHQIGGLTKGAVDRGDCPAKMSLYSTQDVLISKR